MKIHSASVCHLVIHSPDSNQINNKFCFPLPDSPEPVCGENCRKKGPIPSTGVETPPTTGKSAKLCKSCRGHEMTKSATDSGAAGGSKDKDTSHGVVSKSKRSNWALRFNCARLKGSKSSSSIATSSSSIAVPVKVRSTSNTFWLWLGLVVNHNGWWCFSLLDNYLNALSLNLCFLFVFLSILRSPGASVPRKVQQRRVLQRIRS